jgi:hypothetical protein
MNAVFTSLLLILAVFGFHQKVDAQSAAATQPASLSYEDFLEIAGADNDTLIALVNMFYRKRKETKNGFIILGVSYPVAALIGVGGAIGAGLSDSSEDPEKKIQGFFMVYSYLFLGAAAYLTTNAFSYTKARLHKTLADYHTGQPLPNKLIRRIRPTDYKHNLPSK